MTLPKPLVHVGRTGKQRQWRRHKLRALATAEAFVTIDEKQHRNRARRMSDCANLIEMKKVNGRLELARAYRCKQRLCPICDASNARRDFAILAARVAAHAARHPRCLPVMLTLTVPNVPLAGLRTGIISVLAGWRKMTRLKAFKDAVMGWHRSLEITFNDERRDAHPHIHALLFMKDGYFTRNSPIYLTQPSWVELWRRACGIPETKIVDIRRVGRDRNGVFVASADGLFELTKYLVSPIGLYTDADGRSAIDHDVLGAIHAAVRGRRLRDVGLSMRRIRKADLADPRKEDAFAWIESYHFGEVIDPDGVVHGPDYWQRAPPEPLND